MYCVATRAVLVRKITVWVLTPAPVDTFINKVRVSVRKRESHATLWENRAATSRTQKALPELQNLRRHPLSSPLAQLECWRLLQLLL